MQSDLTISIVSSDNLSQLIPCLDSIFEQTIFTSLEVLVIDNASKEDFSNVVSLRHPQVKISRNEHRLGFSTNNNLMFSQSAGRYLMLLNDDTLILEGAIDRLIQFMDANPKAGAVGAYLLNSDGSRQSSFSYFPRPTLEAVFPAANWSHLFYGHSDGPFEVDSVCGAAMVVRKEILNNVGMLDTAFDPIYSEEVDWCFRIKEAGWKVFTHPEAKIIHYGSQTMDQIPDKKYELLQAHKLKFFRKHKGPIAAETYRILFMVSTFIKLIFWSLTSLISAKYAAKRNLHLYLFRQIRYL